MTQYKHPYNQRVPMPAVAGRNWRIVMALSLFLVGCQTAATTSRADLATQASVPALAAPSAYKFGTDESKSMSARVEGDGRHDRLILSLGPNLRQKLADAQGFKTQATAVAQLKYLRITVSGNGIPIPITNPGGLILINGTVNEVVIPAIPVGTNRIIKAQFYDANQQPVANAVAMSVYSSGSGNAIAVDVRRRFVALGTVLQNLLSTQPLLLDSLDASALQAKIDKVLYGGEGIPGPFLVDPVLIDTTKITSDIVAQTTPIANLDLTQPGYVRSTSTLTLPITGLLGSDTVTVRVDDPTSQSVTQGNGTVTITNIAPGTWPVYVTLNSSAGFSYPNSTLGGTLLPNHTAQQSLLVPSQTFVSGQPVAQTAYDLVPTAPQISTPAGIFTRSGSQLTINGSGFYPGLPLANKVRFVQGATTINATVVSVSATQLVLDVPAVPQAGAYTVSAAINNGPFQILGDVAINVLTAIPNGPAYNALTTNGQGWAKAINLQAALGTAVAGDEIWVAQGVHKPVIPVNPASVTIPERQVSFLLKSGVAVYGGFAGTESNKAARNFTANPTILSGDIDNAVDVYDTVIGNGLTHTGITGNSLHVVKGVTGATLDGFTISGGNANGGGIDNDGGGMVNNPSANPSLNNLIFTGNTALNNGAGIVNDSNSSPTVSNTVFRHNTAAQSGGMANFISHPALTQVSFIENAGTTNGGGGMYNVGGSPTLNNVLFLNNRGGNGLVGNGAGGMYNHSGSSPILNKVVFSGNIANGNGGAMHNFSNSSPVLTNVIINNNSASTTGGGGIYNSGTGCNPKLVNVSFNANTAPAGTAVYLVPGSGAFTFVNTLVWNQTFTNLAMPGGQGNVTAGADPYVNSADPDGADNTWFTADDGLRLSGSVFNAVDLGIPTFGGVTVPSVDVLGTARPQGPVIDPGAYELVYQPLSLGTSSGSSNTPVVITGTNLSAATAVKFNGTDAASFTIDSPTQITALVPFGNVTTGKVTVSVPGGPAFSTGNFTVTSRTHLVKANAVGTGSGNNWTNAHTSLQTALTNAVAGDQIWVAAGTYKPGVARASTFLLKANVPVYGGFAGNESTLAARNFTTNLSILDGDVLGNDNAVVTTGDPNRSENNEHVVTSNTANITLDGLTIQGGNTIGVSSDGGGYNIANGTSSNISNLIFRANTAINGGGLFINGGNPTVTNVTFNNNASTSSGAGVFSMGSATPTLSNVSFTNNTSGNGSGLYVNSGTATINNGVFLNNLSTGPLGGGGMYVTNGGANAILNKVVFSGNLAPNGGGMYTNTSNPTLTNVIFTGNSATNRGGGFFNNSGGNPKLVNVTLNGNTAPNGGSAFYNSSGSPVFVNVLLWSNIFGNIALPGSQGNVQAGSDPFVNSADPDGIDDTWFTSDDGLQLSSSANLGIATFGGVTIPLIDVLGLARPQATLYDSGAYEKP